ncbi:MAG: 30S ribosomal protein S17 [Myxococcota bacterium]|jgi:small subunit ribosomal protein S17|nr:30S ribosomal protein S17 [Myxococcota bacterium]
MEERKRGQRRQIEGVVTSDKMEKTVVVKIEHRILHPVYKKYVKRTVTYKAHNPENEAKLGDKVRIQETRPLSREKRWKVVEILVRAV